ncbi:unnamed protein product [Durusdinium trenchii]|uniref:Uncharacterized protein n=1 Tax=Durusdinium trenchii TaxID=1381693 RepID=A0ABP0QVF9_9DINO
MAEETGAIFGIALVQPSLKPADLALENVRFQQPELQEIQIEEAEPDFGAQWTAEENFGYRNSYESWTRYTEDDPEAGAGLFVSPRTGKELKFAIVKVSNPAVPALCQIAQVALALIDMGSGQNLLGLVAQRIAAPVFVSS